MPKTYATYVCLGCGARRPVRMRPNRIAPRPLGWFLPQAVVWEPASGISRAVNTPFCSRACAAAPDENLPEAVALQLYLHGGACPPPPTAVTFQCQGPSCIRQSGWQGEGLPRPPEGWPGFPLMAHDHTTGQSRQTTLWCCGWVCYNGIMAQRHRPGIVRDEEARLIAGLGDVTAPALARVDDVLDRPPGVTVRMP